MKGMKTGKRESFMLYDSSLLSLLFVKWHMEFACLLHLRSPIYLYMHEVFCVFVQRFVRLRRFSELQSDPQPHSYLQIFLGVLEYASPLSPSKEPELPQSEHLLTIS